MHELPLEAQLLSMVYGTPIAQMIGCATEMRVFDILAQNQGPTSAGQVAERADTLAEPTYRLMRALAVLGLLQEGQDQRFELTAMGELLRHERPDSWAPLVFLRSQPWGTVAFEDVMQSLRTGQSAFKLRHGAGLLDWLATRPAERDLYARASAVFAQAETAAILEAYDFSRHRDIVDVGGGKGAFLLSVLAVATKTRGILFDLPDVIVDARRQLTLAPELASRMAFEGGNFFNRVPAGGDLYILRHIIHDWDDVRVARLLRNISSLLPKGGRLMIVERSLTQPGVRDLTKVFDFITMLQQDGARVRTEEQLATLMGGVGIRFEGAIPTESAVTLFVGVKG
jgi:hypothetical protein